ncbi:MAG: type IV pilus modification protein PilV [Methylococcaceae bacterium]|nr:MAG: type IV pilus modification protein PilV [Methylococcaceae bacterium]
MTITGATRSNRNFVKPGSRGFSLIEVLVSLLIVAFGLVGLAGLQAKGLRYSRNAYLNFQAARLIYDMGDRLRANKAGVQAGYYDAVETMPSSNPGCVSDDSPGGGAVDCTPQQMADYDAYRWLNDVAALLPGGVGTVTRSPALASCSSRFNISVVWESADFARANVNTTRQEFNICLDKP